MKTVWKYELTSSQINIWMPKEATILTVACQNEVPCLWALVDSDAPKENRTFCVFGTGHPIHKQDFAYLGTAHLASGALVLHFFEMMGSK